MTITLPVALYWCEICFLTSREGHRLKAFEKMALKGMVGLRRDDLPGGWRKLHSDKLRNIRSSLSIMRMIKSKRIRRVGLVVRMGGNREARRTFVGKQDGKIPL
jgi:hypothetical protein